MIAGNRFSRLLTRAKLSFATRRINFCVFWFWVITPPTTMSKAVSFDSFFLNRSLHIHVRGEHKSTVGCRQKVWRCLGSLWEEAGGADVCVSEIDGGLTNWFWRDRRGQHLGPETNENSVKASKTSVTRVTIPCVCVCVCVRAFKWNRLSSWDRHNPCGDDYMHNHFWSLTESL